MSISARPVSEIYTPQSLNKLIPPEPSDHYAAWGYDIAYEVDRNEEAFPDGSNTAIYRIYPGGMTEPVWVTKKEPDSKFQLTVLLGQGVLIRAIPGGPPHLNKLDGNNPVIRPGWAYSIVNTGDTDLLIRDVATPAFQAGDDVELTKSQSHPGKGPLIPPEDMFYTSIETEQGELNTIWAATFFDTLGEAAAGRLRVY